MKATRIYFLKTSLIILYNLSTQVSVFCLFIVRVAHVLTTRKKGVICICRCLSEYVAESRKGCLQMHLTSWVWKWKTIWHLSLAQRERDSFQTAMCTSVWFTTCVVICEEASFFLGKKPEYGNTGQQSPG